jgi:hypothetical protein
MRIVSPKREEKKSDNGRRWNPQMTLHERQLATSASMAVRTPNSNSIARLSDDAELLWPRVFFFAPPKRKEDDVGR